MINVGFVYTELDDLHNQLEKLLQVLTAKQAILLKWKVCLDDVGKEWIEQKEHLDLPTFIKGYYGELFLQFKLISMPTPLEVRLSLQKEGEFCGFVFHFSEKDFKNHSIDEKEVVFCAFIKRVADYISFKYAYCDDEAEIEVHPNLVDTINTKYSIIYWPLKEQFIKNAWKIDGLTPRDEC